MWHAGVWDQHKAAPEEGGRGILQAKGIAFETMLYPGLRHRAGWSQGHLRHRMEAALDFFARKLGAQHIEDREGPAEGGKQ